MLYLINVKDVYPLGRDIVGPKDLKEGHFFQGPHELKTAPLVERFGADVQGFHGAAEVLCGERVDMADAAYRLKPFPRVNLYYLLWEGDDEFPARMSVLFERSIEETLAADAIWGLVSRVSTALLTVIHANFICPLVPPHPTYCFRRWTESPVPNGRFGHPQKREVP